MMTIKELSDYIDGKIQGVFGGLEMEVLKEEIEKLEPFEVYVEIGVDEGKSFAVANHYAGPTIWKIGIDINDPGSRGKFMQNEGIVGLEKKGFWVHGDADMFSAFIIGIGVTDFVDLLFIDGHHDYDSVKKNTLFWEPLVKKDGVILFHDYDHPETKRWLDEHYKDNKEVIGGKIVRVFK